jgi:hypothetical protein
MGPSQRSGIGQSLCLCFPCCKCQMVTYQLVIGVGGLGWSHWREWRLLRGQPRATRSISTFDEPWRALLSSTVHFSWATKMKMLAPTTHQRSAPLSPCAHKQINNPSFRPVNSSGIFRAWPEETHKYANVAPYELLQAFANTKGWLNMTEMAFVVRLPGNDHATILCSIHHLYALCLCPTGSWPLWKPKWITCWPVESQARDEFQRLRCIPVRFNVNIR